MAVQATHLEASNGGRRAENGGAAAEKPIMWDCGSSLYDSFELKSFERHLHSAIIVDDSARSLSMPHLPDRGRRTIPAPLSQAKGSISPPSSSRISRSFQKLLRSVFRHKQTNPAGASGKQRRQNLVPVPEPSRGAALSTIPEYEALSPEIRSLVRRTASERFTAAASTVGISCA
ncbi:unnamed protein product [Cuscuta campestris]|uniref:Uncharacterized protein n=1 Tax=Cuscuta campestris TaxID=132261 RepID=A0A484KYP5_9ASTE|nr:unnamed protein product [Cuscuta campestris]